METQDIRYAARRLARTPSFTVIALATLALSIGATTTVFSIVNGVLLKSLNFGRPDRLVYVQSKDARGVIGPIAPQDMLDYRDQTHSFTDMAAVDADRNLNLVRSSASPLRIKGARVGATFFSLLGVNAQLGRMFAPGEDSKNATKVVVLSDRAWRQYFAADARIVGQTITLNGQPYVVVGVAPGSFRYPETAELWYPAVWYDFEIGNQNRGFHSITAIARLRDGISLASARRDLASVADRIARDFPKNDAGTGAIATPLRTIIVGDVESPLWSMFGAVAFVLLIACANIANLLLVRAASRQSDVAVRTALGAGRRELLRQFLTESMVLTLLGTALGIVLATVAIEAARRMAPLGLPRMNEVTIDGRVLVFSAAVAIATGLVFGLLPTLHASGWDVAHMLRSGPRGARSGGGRTRSILVLAELALGTVLLVGAGLLIRSFERLTHVNPGFRADHLIVFDAAMSGKKYDYDAPMNTFTDQVQQSLAAIPGVQSVAVAANRPFDVGASFSGSVAFTVDGAPRPPEGLEPTSRILPVSPNFFATLGMSLARGRLFTDAENRLDANPVIVINDALAREYFPGVDPIGKHLTFGMSHEVSVTPGDTVRTRGEIIGVVRSPTYSSLRDKPGPATFFPYHTLPEAATFAVRTTVNPAAITPAIRRAVAAADPTIPTYEIGTMDEALAESLAKDRFYTLLLAAFASVALLLATLGVYGVISYAVSQQTRDFGIRIALGARSRDVIGLVLGRGAVLIAAGLGAGIGGAVVLTRVIRTLLFNVQPLDAPTFASVAVLFAIAATVASWLPARRAARVDPVLAMRAE